MANTLAYVARDYQEDGARQIEAAFESKEGIHVLYVLPTGAGKTDVAVNVVERAHEHGEKVLFLAHRHEIISQTYDRVVARGIDPATVGVMMGADDRKNPDARLQIASIQTLIHRNLDDVDLIVVDEAHHATAPSYRRIMLRYPKAIVLGLTATPYRGDGRGLGDVFDSMVTGPSFKELSDLGWLSTPRSFTKPEARLPDLVGVSIEAGDYNKEQLAERVDRAELVGDIIDHWTRLALDRRTVVYAVNIEHAKNICHRFLEAGIVAEHLDAGTPSDERKGILARLRSGETSVVTNCEILTEGWDLVELGCVIIARPTLSGVMHNQMCGRATRGKADRPVILDHAGNFGIHGLIEMDREHSLTSKKIQRTGVKRCKVCPECDAMIANITATCPECGHVFWTGAAPAEVTGELREVRVTEQEQCANACGTIMSPTQVYSRTKACCRKCQYELVSKLHGCAGNFSRFDPIAYKKRTGKEGAVIAPKWANYRIMLTNEQRASLFLPSRIDGFA